MKIRILLLLIFIILPYFSYCQLEIVAKESNGLYVIPCKVNEIPMSFIFDTGASQVMLSKTEALFLIKNGSLTEKDIIGTSSFKIADGEIKTGLKVRLRSIKIGNLELNDIVATIVDNPNAPLLLGQNVLSKLGKITIEDNKLIIHNTDVINSNCDFYSTFLFKIGISNFDISLIESKNNLTRVSKEIKNELVQEVFKKSSRHSSMESFSYLDHKVKTSLINLYESNIYCTDSKEYHYQLYLVEDYLYKINIRSEYKEIGPAMDYYNFILSIIPQEYLYKSTNTISNTKTHEKVGEGATFYKVPKNKRTNKTEHISIDYMINYEIIHHYNKPTEHTTNIESFKVEVQVVNLKETILTNQGY